MKKKKENWQLKCEKTNIKKKDLYSELLEVKNMYKICIKREKLKKAVTKVDKRQMENERKLNRSPKHILHLCSFFPSDWWSKKPNLSLHWIENHNTDSQDAFRWSDVHVRTRDVQTRCGDTRTVLSEHAANAAVFSSQTFLTLCFAAISSFLFTYLFCGGMEI